MNNQRLPAYPEHPEPMERHDSAEFERETRPRVHPGTMVWMGLALLVGIFFAQKYIAEHVGPDQPVVVKPPAQLPVPNQEK